MAASVLFIVNNQSDLDFQGFVYLVSFITKTFHAVIKEHNSILKANYISVTSMFFDSKKGVPAPKIRCFL